MVAKNTCHEIDFKQTDWGTDGKQAYRRQCIIEPYREYYNRQSIPQDKQYWTLCGAHTIKGLPMQGCELEQLTTDPHLIQAGQFVGVDNDLDIINSNKLALPEATWIHSDFADAIHNAKLFNPAIVHADTINMSHRAIDLILSIASRIEEHRGQVMLIANVVYKRPFKKGDPKQFAKSIIDLLDDRWRMSKQVYIYSRLNNKSSRMCAHALFYEP